MDLKTYRKALALLYHVFDQKTSTEPRIVTHSQKPLFDDSKPVLQPFMRISPESKGISSDYIAGFLEALQNDTTLDLHNIMILCDGAVITEGSFGAYNKNLWHITHSECKSITALAIGMLIDEGKLCLDDRITKIFEKRASVLSQITHKNLTIRHLLTMTSGIQFNEAGAVTEDDWVKCFFESSIRSEPGKQFSYNSMNTYILSAIVKQISGQGLMEYLRKRLWEPLGITEIFWECCPKGIEKGGWGLYIRPEDIAKIGQLVMQKGKWNDRQLVSEGWITQATTTKITTPASMGDYNYGYQIWTGREQNSFLFNGMFGQNLLGYPDTGLLIVSNAGNNELFQQSSFFNIVHKFFYSDFRSRDSLPDNHAAYKRLQMIQNNLGRISPPKKANWLSNLFDGGNRKVITELCTLCDGKTYIADEAVSATVGLLPVLAQVIQNNYTKGLKSIGFECKSGIFYLIVEEADNCFRLPVGFETPEYADLTFHGEPYKVGISGKFTTNEDDITVLKVRISFLEIANTRFLKIFFYQDKIITKWSESPGKEYITEALAALMSEVKSHPVVDTLVSKADNDFVLYKISKTLEPKVTAKLKQN